MGQYSLGDNRGGDGGLGGTGINYGYWASRWIARMLLRLFDRGGIYRMPPLHLPLMVLLGVRYAHSSNPIASFECQTCCGELLGTPNIKFHVG